MPLGELHLGASPPGWQSASLVGSGSMSAMAQLTSQRGASVVVSLDPPALRIAHGAFPQRISRTTASRRAMVSEFFGQSCTSPFLAGASGAVFNTSSEKSRASI